jgi:uncharacterized protein (TIGR02145 family)
MKKFTLAILAFLLITSCFAQVGIGTDTPDTSSILDLTSTDKALLLPRMNTVQRILIINPVAGMVIFNTDSSCIEIYRNNTGWFNICTGNSSGLMGGPTPCGQMWMAKNLDVTNYNNGDSIPEVTDSAQWSNLTTGAWCWYNNDSADYAAIYGRLYNWYAVSDPRGLAPTGWHIPSDSEWNALVLCLDPAADTTCIDCGQSSTAGGALKDTGTTYWFAPNTGATNSIGFSGLPGGHRYDYGAFSNVSLEADWWTSTPSLPNKAYFHFLSYYNGYEGRNTYGMGNGFSVRCVKN